MNERKFYESAQEACDFDLEIPEAGEEWFAKARLVLPDPLVTIRVSPYITWQGPASRAAEAGRF